jgi:hypothetical protein
MDGARMPVVKMGRNSKKDASGVVTNDLDHILDGLIGATDRAYGVRVRVHTFEGSTQHGRGPRRRRCLAPNCRTFIDLTGLGRSTGKAQAYRRDHEQIHHPQPELSNHMHLARLLTTHVSCPTPPLHSFGRRRISY